MATTVYTPVEEYLRTSYRPDRDYLEGELEERNVGEQWHGLIEKVIAAVFFNNRKTWKLRSINEQRVQVTPTRFRVPDVCVVSSETPIEPILLAPPILCVEVLSPEDRFSRITERVQDYTDMGVPHVWIIDSVTRKIWIANGNERPVPLQGDALTLPGTLVRIPVAEIFAEIDEAPPAL
ncbi:Uma2 family endonuclease [Terriglobus sp.]|uniref:Uma2 family endonuclease n=1 Tax=Terriglobus sp. TaxID=1889013 RepID=UPI003AFFDFD6